MSAFPFPKPPQGAYVVTDPGELEVLFSRNRPAHLYSLVDLEPPFWPNSRWYRRGDATVGLIGTEPGQLVTGCSVSTADPDGSSALLAEVAVDLRFGLVITGSPGMAAALSDRRPATWKTDEVRYGLPTLPAVVGSGTVPLGTGHIASLERLYATEPGAAFFLPSMVSDGAFVGVWNEDETELIAAAGTHVLSDQKRIAAIGAVFVRPDQRGRGLGTRTTLGVLERLSGRVDTIGLNASGTNQSARSIYEKLGFVPVLEFEEAELPALEIEPA